MLMQLCGSLCVYQGDGFLKHGMVAFERSVFQGLTPVGELSEEGSQCAAEKYNNPIDFFIPKAFEVVQPLKCRVIRGGESDTVGDIVARRSCLWSGYVLGRVVKPPRQASYNVAIYWWVAACSSVGGPATDRWPI